MHVTDHSTRLFYVQGESTIEKAFSISGETVPVSNGRCIYLSRIELAPKGHPEITRDTLELTVIDGWAGVSYNDHLRRREGDVIPFNELIKNPSFPPKRAKEKRSQYLSDPLESGYATLNILLSCRWVFNSNFKIYTEYEGFWGLLRRDFDPFQTYFGLVYEAYEQVVDTLGILRLK